MEFRSRKIGISILILISGMFILIPQESNAQIELIGSCEIPAVAEFIEIQGDYAYVSGSSQILNVIDISEPANPFIVADYDTSGFAWGMDANSGYAFIAYGGLGLHIIDVSDPLDPVFAGDFDGEQYEHAVIALENIAYLLTCYRLYAIDISQPTAPLEIGNISTNSIESIGIFIEGDYAYIAADWEEELKIIDISDPANMELRGTCSDLNFSGGYSTDLCIRNRYAYIPAYQEIQIVDVHNPDNPSFVGSYDLQHTAHAIEGADDYLFLANSIFGLQILDISNPVLPFLVDQYDTHGYGYRDVYYRDGLIYAIKGFQLDIFVFGTLEVENENNIPNKISYLDVYPNPFNPATTINYSLIESSDITLAIYNLLGQCVATVYEGVQDGGEHSITWDASDFPSGVYFARLESGESSENVKMVLLK
ncbi:MAG: T9SS type A sorting domain-containing protein [candidate division Zixibacteria bacterium]